MLLEKEKLTENEVVLILIDFLKLNGWTIESYCLGQQRGNDIVASKDGKTLIIEAKGAKANDSSPTKKRAQFSGGQIKKHFGAAIVKILEQKNQNPDYLFGIARPDDSLIRKHTGELIHHLRTLKIKHFWVSNSGIKIEE